MMMAMTSIRPAQELAGVPDPAWPEWLELIRLAPVPTVVLPVDLQSGLEVLFRLQVTARSMMGALALNSGGMLVDHGWVRLLGGGSGDLPDLAAANGLGAPGSSGPPPWLTVAFDVLGGRFAVNGGGLPGRPGEVCYRGPDTLARMAGRGGRHRHGPGHFDVPVPVHRPKPPRSPGQPPARAVRRAARPARRSRTAGQPAAARFSRPHHVHR
jgi:Protein of unknown function DUF2625